MSTPSPRRGLRLSVVVAILWAAAASGVVGWQVTVGRATAHRAAEVAEALADATCPFNRDLASLPITPQTGEIGRRLVRDAAAAYQRVCTDRYGPLPPVDPAAYSPAPPATSTPPPGRSATPTPAGTPTRTPSSSASPDPPMATPSWHPTRSTHDSRPTLPDPGRPQPQPRPVPSPTPTVVPTPGLCVDLPVLGLCIR